MLKVKISTTIDKLLYEQIKKIAESEGRHINYYIENGLKLLIKDKEV
jgi:hypothetical protein